MEKSKYWPWIDILPKSYDYVLSSWPDKFDSLMMPNIYESKHTELSDLKDAFKRITRSFDAKSAGFAVSAEELQYAFATVRSRQ